MNSSVHRIEHVITLPDITGASLRAEGRRFGRHKADEAAQLMRHAHAHGVLTEDVVDGAVDAIEHDIRKTVQNLAGHVPAAKLALFDRAARRAARGRMKELWELAK